MTGPWQRIAATLIAALSIASLLAACGGGEMDTTAAGPATSTTAADEGGGTQTAPAQIRSNVRTGPLRVTAGGPKQFRDIDEYSTLSFGKEASKSELEQAAQTMHAYLVANVKHDWSTSCTYLNEREVEEVDTLASHFKKIAGKECPVALAGLIGRVASPDTVASSEVVAGAFRVNQDVGYLFYRAAGSPYMMPMSREGNEWKLYSLFTTQISQPPKPPTS